MILKSAVVSTQLISYQYEAVDEYNHRSYGSVRIYSLTNFFF